MDNFILKDLYMGENDGRKEAAYRPQDFDKFFVDIDKNAEKIREQKIFLVLGRKGSGKTFFGQYIRKLSESDPLHFCTISSYKDFKFQELVHLKSQDIKPNEYYEIWRWLLLLDIGKLCLSDEGIPNSRDKEKLINFFDCNYQGIGIDAKKIVEITKKKEVRGGFLRSYVGGSEDDKEQVGTYLDYIDDLEKVVFNVLSESSSTYTSIYDELDDRFRNDDYYKDSMISLLKAADNLNLKFLEKGLKTKVIVLLRTDIFSIFNDPDLNKIKRVNSIKIEWSTKIHSTAPLMKMICHKAKESSSLMRLKGDSAVFKMLFPQDIKGINPERFILERSFFRPRDIITYLNLIIERYPQSTYFGWKGFVELKNEYSDYLLDEVRNEMYGHYHDVQIDLIIKLLKNYNKHFLKYPELKEYMDSNSFHYEGLELEKMLIGLFKFNAIGNRWFNEYKRCNYYTWAHRDDKADLDLGKEIAIHIGLREALSM